MRWLNNAISFIIRTIRFKDNLVYESFGARAPTRSPQGGRARQNAAKIPPIFSPRATPEAQGERAPASEFHPEPSRGRRRRDGGARVIYSGAQRRALGGAGQGRPRSGRAKGAAYGGLEASAAAGGKGGPGYGGKPGGGGKQGRAKGA